MRRARIDRWAEYWPWAVLLVGVPLDLAMSRSAWHDLFHSGMLALFYLSLLARLAVAVAVSPGRRARLLTITVGLTLFATASVIVYSNPTPPHFPSPDEGLYLLAYCCFGSFLLLDGVNRNDVGRLLLLEVLVLMGGVASLAVTVVVSVVSGTSPAAGIPLLSAVVYPIADLVLLLMTLGQVISRARRLEPRAVFLLAGLALLTTVDCTLASAVTSGVYTSSPVQDAAWGVALSLIATGAARPARQWIRPPDSAGHLPMWLTVASALGALLVLTLPTRTALHWYLVVPAVMTLAAAVWLLVVSLRQARRMTEAIHLAQTDDLTGLPNRRAVLATIDERLRRHGPLALMLLDLDGFKDVNDTLGHQAGDDLLVLIARRIAGTLPPEAFFGRLGGDEFAFLTSHVDLDELTARGRRIVAALQEPLRLGDLRLTVGTSIGIAASAGPGQTTSDLLRRADVAMYQAKESRAGLKVYDIAQDGFSREKLQLADELRAGIEEGQLEVYYQPQVSALTGEMVSVEALVRWRHPERGLLLPGQFLDIARRNGSMLPLSLEVMYQAVTRAALWRDHGRPLRVALNVAGAELLGGGWVPALIDRMAEVGLEPDLVTVELTEEMFLSDPPRARQVVDELAAHGVEISIDDYGTGFSSLAYLQQLRVNELKIDRSFVMQMDKDERSRLIVQFTAGLAHALDLRVVAEGVEDATTAAALSAMGVQLLQGYYVARPMPADEVQDWSWAQAPSAAAAGSRPVPRPAGGRGRGSAARPRREARPEPGRADQPRADQPRAEQAGSVLPGL